jgi:hypothetical protein
MTSDATLCLERRVFIGEWTLLVSMTFNACRISAGSQPGLLKFEAAVGVVTIAALHHSFQNFMVKRLIEVGLYLGVTTYAELRLADFQQMDG